MKCIWFLSEIGCDINGLDASYNPFVSSMTAKDSITLSDLYAQLLAYEARLNQQHIDGGHFYSSANNAARGHGCSRGVVLFKAVVPLKVVVWVLVAVVPPLPVLMRIKMMFLFANCVNEQVIRYIPAGTVLIVNMLPLAIVEFDLHHRRQLLRPCILMG
jgi:hypothetical protein